MLARGLGFEESTVCRRVPFPPTRRMAGMFSAEESARFEFASKCNRSSPNLTYRTLSQ